jgi:hypothetical protein
MFQAIVGFVARPFVALWLRYSQFSWRRLTVANDSPQVHAPGTNPDRLLIAGDGASAGFGVLTHDLGLPGYLARCISAITGRATDVDIVVSPTMTAESCLRAIAGLNLTRFDAILLSPGVNEALDFLPLRQWRRDLNVLLASIESRAAASTSTLVLSIPLLGPTTRLPRVLAWAVDPHITAMNAATQKVLAGFPGMSYVPFQTQRLKESDGSHAYEVWASAIAPFVVDHLDRPGAQSSRVEDPDEPARQRAVDAVMARASASNQALARLTTIAKELFGVSGAEVTFIDRDRQWVASAMHDQAEFLERSNAFCDITIRRASHFVIEDTRLDPRYADNPMVTGEPRIRFYAGYPIESPDGHRVGAFCITDPQPRRFTDRDARLLRNLALQAQETLWA